MCTYSKLLHSILRDWHSPEVDYTTSSAASACGSDPGKSWWFFLPSEDIKILTASNHPTAIALSSLDSQKKAPLLWYIWNNLLSIRQPEWFLLNTSPTGMTIFVTLDSCIIQWTSKSPCSFHSTTHPSVLLCADHLSSPRLLDFTLSFCLYFCTCYSLSLPLPLACDGIAPLVIASLHKYYFRAKPCSTLSTEFYFCWLHLFLFLVIIIVSLPL